MKRHAWGRSGSPPRLARAWDLRVAVVAALILALVRCAVLGPRHDLAALALSRRTGWRRRAQSLVLTDRQGRPLRVLPLPGGGRAAWVPLDRVRAAGASPATLAGEDHRFFEHGGVDGRAVVRAAWLAVRHGRVRLGRRRPSPCSWRARSSRTRARRRASWARWSAALRLERALGKHGILEQYLNRVYYGNGAYGIEAAARRYFGQPAAALSRRRGDAAGGAAARAARLRSPPPPATRRWRRRAHVLELMQTQRLARRRRAGRASRPSRVAAGWRARASRRAAAPHFVDWVLASCRRGAARRGGAVRTTLDLAAAARGWSGRCARTSTAAGAGLRQAGVVVLDPAHRRGAGHGRLGRSTRAADGGQLNITTTPRHPGSALKPFVYALAIERGDQPGLDRPTIAGDAVPGYRPRRPHARARPGPLPRGAGRLVQPGRRGRAGAGGRGAAAGAAARRPASARWPAGRRLRPGPGAGLGARCAWWTWPAAYGFLVNGGRVCRARAAAPTSARRGRSQLFRSGDQLAGDGHAGRPRRPPRRRSAPSCPWICPSRWPPRPAPRRASPTPSPSPPPARRWWPPGPAPSTARGTRGHLAMWSAAPLVRAGLLAVARSRGAPLTLPAAAPGRRGRATVCAVTGLAPAAGLPAQARALRRLRCPHQHLRRARAGQPRPLNEPQQLI